MSCWYSSDSSHWVLSDEYLHAGVSIIFLVFLHHFVLPKLASSSIKGYCIVELMVLSDISRRGIQVPRSFVLTFSHMEYTAGQTCMNISWSQNNIFSNIWLKIVVHDGLNNLPSNISPNVTDYDELCSNLSDHVHFLCVKGLSSSF